MWIIVFSVIEIWLNDSQMRIYILNRLIIYLIFTFDMFEFMISQIQIEFVTANEIILQLQMHLYATLNTQRT